MWISDNPLKGSAVRSIQKSPEGLQRSANQQAAMASGVPTGLEPTPWHPPTVVLDEGLECCADECTEFVDRPMCVTEAEIRRYFEQVDHVVSPDVINCSASSDNNVCDSLHGDARGQDDDWGKGWLDAMRK